jgi:protein-S-isoprenylcysteine O-methyltransferase Ste14
MKRAKESFMASEIYRLALYIVADVSFARFGWIVVGLIRGRGNYRRATGKRLGLVELMTIPEAFVLAVITYLLFINRTVPAHVGGAALLAAVSGAALAALGLVISVWAFLSLTTMSVGHYVLKEQAVVEKGPYRWVRHPVYLGVFLIWFAVAITFQSTSTFLIAALYVVPAYALYIRSEEQMMAASYGAQYVNYCRRVGMLIPRPRGAATSL